MLITIALLTVFCVLTSINFCPTLYDYIYENQVCVYMFIYRIDVSLSSMSLPLSHFLSLWVSLPASLNKNISSNED